MARRRTSFRQGRTQKRLTDWFNFELIPVSITANGVLLAGTLSAAALVVAPFTIVRTRGIILFESDQTGATEDYGGVMSFQVVTAAAAAAGVASIPTPLTEPNADYFVYEPFYSKVWIQNTGANAGGSTVSKQFDSKAMRKFTQDDQAVIVFEMMGLPGGANVGVLGRMLVKLH